MYGEDRIFEHTRNYSNHDLSLGFEQVSCFLGHFVCQTQESSSATFDILRSFALRAVFLVHGLAHFACTNDSDRLGPPFVQPHEKKRPIYLHRRRASVSPKERFDRGGYDIDVFWNRPSSNVFFLAYFCLKFFPVIGKDGKVAGFYETITESSNRIILDRRVNTFIDVGSCTASARSLDDFWPR